jgi:hypothetical protein
MDSPARSRRHDASRSMQPGLPVAGHKPRTGVLNMSESDRRLGITLATLVALIALISVVAAFVP